MKDWLRKLFTIKRMTAEQRSKAHLAILTLAAGSAIRSDEDGVIRVEEIKNEEDIV